MRITKTFCIILAMAFVAGAEESKAASSGPCVALTFDDGPSSTLTPKLLDILEAAHVPATFFVVGNRVVQWPDIVAREHNDGFEIGNHSWDHPYLTHLSDDAVRREFSRTDEAIHNAAGIYPTLFRAPYGDRSARVDNLAGRPDILWDYDTLDWQNHNPTIITRVAAHSGSGIVLMHDIHATTIQAVPGLIAELKAEGATFVTVSDYYNGGCSKGTAPQVAQATPAPTPKVATVVTKPAAAKAAPALVKPAVAVVAAPAFTPPVVRAPYKLYDDDN